MSEKEKLTLLRNKIIEYKRMLRLAEQSLDYGGGKLAITLMHQATTMILDTMDVTENLPLQRLRSKIRLIKRECVKKLEENPQGPAAKQILKRAISIIPGMDLILFKMIKTYVENHSVDSTTDLPSSETSWNRSLQASHPRLYSP